MSISSTLSNATSGMTAATRRADIVSNNLANALTPGYSRREIHVSARTLGGAGAGVQVDGVSQVVDKALTSDRRIAEGATARNEVTTAAYASFNTALGEPGEAFSLFTQYQNFESSLRQLAQSPESQPLQSQTLDDAKALTHKLNDLSDHAQDVRMNADSAIAREVDFLNATLQEVVKLNKSITAAAGAGRDVTALQDQRRNLIDEISTIIPIREVSRERGAVDLITDEGVFLIAGEAREIEFLPANTIGPNETLGSPLSGLTVAGTDITPGLGTSLSIKDGSLAGHFAVRDQIATDYQSQLDGMARDVIERFEGIDPTLSPGDPGLFTDAGTAFDAANETGLAQRISINAAVDPAQGGSLWRLRDGLGATTQGAAGASQLINTLLDALTEIKPPPASTGQSGSLSAAGIAANITSAMGQARLNAENALASTSARSESLRDAEQNLMAVDSDAELQKLLLIEKAFSANARVIQAADQMMQRLLEI